MSEMNSRGFGSPLPGGKRFHCLAFERIKEIRQGEGSTGARGR
jgi:hypothetical protein